MSASTARTNPSTTGTDVKLTTRNWQLTTTTHNTQPQLTTHNTNNSNDNGRAAQTIAPPVLLGPIMGGMLASVATRLAVAGIIASQLPSQSIPIGFPDGREFVIHVSPAVDAGSCNLASFQSGGFGGVGGAPVREAGGGVFAIRTGIGAKPATNLKVAVWCRGFAIALVDVALLDSSTYRSNLVLSPLASVVMAGQVLPTTDGVNLAGSSLRVWYVASWLCGFFNLPDCGVPQWEVAAGRIERDSTFRIEVPNVVADPVVRRRTSAASFSAGHFRMRADRHGAPFHYWLEPPGAQFAVIAPASEYPHLRLQPRAH